MLQRYIRPLCFLLFLAGVVGFALATGRTGAEVNFVKLCAAAAEVTARAIANALIFSKL